MGLFDKWKRKTIDWSSAYQAEPKFYEKPDGTPFGAIALTEGTETVLPVAPQKNYRIDGKSISEWKLVLVSTTKDTIIGDADYFAAVEKIRKYALDKKQESILVKGLSLDELENIRGAV